MTTTASDLQPIEAALAEVRLELARADQKAATLLALFSAIAAGIIAMFAARPSGIFSLWNAVEWLAWAGLACLACSLAYLLFCVRPYGVGHPGGTSYFVSYARYAKCPGELLARLTSGAATGEERCGQLAELSAIVTRKYRLIARAVDLLGCSLLCITTAALLDSLH